MEHALQRPTSIKSLAIPLAAAVLGAGVATGTYAVVDDSGSPPAKVVIEQAPSASQAAAPTPMAGPRP